MRRHPRLRVTIAFGLAACSVVPGVPPAVTAPVAATAIERSPAPAPAVPAALVAQAALIAPAADADRPLPSGFANTPDLLPAGRCAFDGYLGNRVCGDLPRERYAVVLTVAGDEAIAEASLRRGQALGLAAGYPFAETLDEMPTHDPNRRGIAVVAGLFAEEAAAAAYREHLPAGTEVLELASPEEAAKRSVPPSGVNWNVFEKTRSALVVIAEDTPAWTAADLEAVESRLDEDLARKWVRFPAQRVRRTRALAALKPACTIARGRVFTTDHDELYRFMRHYAPARCDDGREVWVEWRATRRESVVIRTRNAAVVHQVVLVECDQPVVETRRFAARSAEKPIRVRLGGPC